VIRRLAPALALALALALVSGCGGPSAGTGPTLTVLAAASLNQAFPQIADALHQSDPSVVVRFSFAGTDALAAQIEQGAPADVFAPASVAHAGRLWDRGLVRFPRIFATNRLVIVVPSSDPAGITSPRDLSRPGVRLVIGSETVPIGEYTRTALTELDALYGGGYLGAVLANVASREESVEAVLTKVRLGEADAGVVYVTDARAAASDVRSIRLPDQALVVAHYSIALVEASLQPEEAEAFVAFVLGAEGQRILGEAGFGPPPSS
jgi:molybdate transport system substrate-binding protein